MAPYREHALLRHCYRRISCSKEMNGIVFIISLRNLEMLSITSPFRTWRRGLQRSSLDLVTSRYARTIQLLCCQMWLHGYIFLAYALMNFDIPCAHSTASLSYIVAFGDADDWGDIQGRGQAVCAWGGACVTIEFNTEPEMVYFHRVTFNNSLRG